jgi:hypothetical protein
MKSSWSLPDDASPLLRGLARVGRRVLFASYVRGYRRVRSLDLALVRRWEWVCAAARLSEGIEVE